MKLVFHKYHGAGNDFIVIDNRDKNITQDFFSITNVNFLCNRRLGIGADGLMILNPSNDFDFKMRYFNSDGKEGSMCGNGGRCITSFANDLGIINNEAKFLAIDGVHDSKILANSGLIKTISLKMQDVRNIEINENYSFLNTGSPHHVSFIEKVKEYDVFNEGRKIRYSDKYSPEGTNVNFVELIENGLFVRTYERGVEEETLSCGTGVTASTIAAFENGLIKSNSCNIQTLGGNFEVSFEKKDGIYQNIYLEGPATFVFKGEIEYNLKD
ncbi:MAG: diaminopimelate epimerase [Bacteroidetes bacterium]|nr:diaminopimelate epimerase [Bacteroidota bacterium]